MEEETIKERINSKSIQLQNKKNTFTGLTDARPSIHPEVIGYTNNTVSVQFFSAEWDQGKKP